MTLGSSKNTDEFVAPLVARRVTAVLSLLNCLNCSTTIALLELEVVSGFEFNSEE